TGALGDEEDLGADRLRGPRTSALPDGARLAEPPAPVLSAAGRGKLLPWPETARRTEFLFPLGQILDGRIMSRADEVSKRDIALRMPQEVLERYAGAIDLVDPDDPRAITSCFTAAYGRSTVRSGSYLRTADGARRFSPEELLRLLGFPA